MAAAPDTGDQGMMCPFADSAVEVEVEEVEGGSALIITTDTTNGATQDQVAFLRDWAQDRAAQSNGQMDMHGQGMHGQGMEMDEQGMEMDHQRMQDQGMQMIPPAETTATDVPDGVALTIRAKRPEDVSELREQVSEHAEMIREGQCPMLRSEPMETEPMQTEPMEAEPMEPEPMEPDPMETEPMETEPMETEPMETEPMETEPMDPALETTP